MLPKNSGTCINRHRMRCSRGRKGCGTRFTLKKNPGKYANEIKCPSCGSVHVNSVEQERRRESLNNDTCSCHFYPFPHKRASMRMCMDHPNKEEPTWEETVQYEDCLRTERAG